MNKLLARAILYLLLIIYVFAISFLVILFAAIGGGWGALGLLSFGVIVWLTAFFEWIRK